MNSVRIRDWIWLFNFYFVFFFFFVVFHHNRGGWLFRLPIEAFNKIIIHLSNLRIKVNYFNSLRTINAENKIEKKNKNKNKTTKRKRKTL